MVKCIPAAFAFVELEHRPVDDPGQLVLAFRDQVPALGQPGTQSAEDGGDLVRLVGGDQHQVTFFGVHRRVQAGQLLGTEELGDRGAPAVPLAKCPDEALGAELLGVVDQAVELGPRKLPLPEVDAPDRATGLDHAAEGLELRATQDLCQIGDLVAVAGIGLVRAETGDRFVVAHPRERDLDLDPHLAEQVDHQLLVQLDHVLARDEAHLYVELGEVGLAVGSQVLVAEAAGDLEVALETGDHQQLLEQLRGLRKRVEGPAVLAARHEEIASAFRSRAGQDRGLDLEEALSVQEAAHRGGQTVAQFDRALHRLAAQVEVAVAQPRLLPGFRAEAFDRERRRIGFGQHLGFSHVNLELTGRELGVDGLRFPGHDLAGDRDHVLRTQPVAEVEGAPGFIGVEYELDEPGPVPQVDEDQTAVIPAPVNPARDPHRLAHTIAQNLAAPGVTVGIRTQGWSVHIHGRASLSGKGVPGPARCYLTLTRNERERFLKSFPLAFATQTVGLLLVSGIAPASIPRHRAAGSRTSSES